MKVLVADDEATARRVLTRTVERFGYEAEVVQDGEEAWRLLRDVNGPQIAVLDWNMPRLSGIELCERLRRELRRYVYVILVTARSQTEDVVAGLAAGADEFISKPVEPEELGARLRTAKRIVDLQSESERSRSYLTAILGTIDCGVLLSDAQGRVVYSNEMLARMSNVPTALTVAAIRDEFPWSHGVPAGAPDSVAVHRPREKGCRDFEVQAPRRVLRQTTVPVVLPEGAGTLDIYRDITSEVEYASQIAQLATTDVLTGTSNRRGAEQAMLREIGRARRTGSHLTFVLLDIDRFKQVNDAFGHEVGDRVLQAVAKILTELVRVTDVVARWGGEEFLLLLSATAAEGALVLADRIRMHVANHQAPGLPQITLSAGIAELRPEDLTGADALRRADERLYEAKRSGRNCVH